MNAPYLVALNDNQRAAVTFGDVTASPARPLLIIAGAGSGKTRTLAHRVTHLLTLGADVRRTLLMTFLRSAAKDLTTRVEQLVARVGVTLPAGALSWPGTFHAVGACILSEHEAAIGLDPDFSSHDREDSADLMNLVRHELGFSVGDHWYYGCGFGLVQRREAIGQQPDMRPVGGVSGAA